MRPVVVQQRFGVALHNLLPAAGLLQATSHPPGDLLHQGHGAPWRDQRDGFLVDALPYAAAVGAWPGSQPP
jgi:hypothetical protein